MAVLPVYIHNLNQKETPDQELINSFNRYYLPSMIVFGVSIAIDFVVIFGAWIYSRRLVVLGVVWSIVAVILQFALNPTTGDDPASTVLFIIVSLVWGLITLYPLIIFINEVSRGIMSPLTYDREQHCCSFCA